MKKIDFLPLSFSSLKAFSTSPAHFVAYKNRQQHETPAMRFGTAVHSATLEPEKFEDEYKVLTVRRGTKAYKALEEEHPNAIWLTQTEYEDIQKLKEAVLSHDIASKLLKDCTAYEVALEGSISGLPFRGFADGVSTKYVVDLKTTQKGAPRDFTNDAYRQKYHMQGYIYTKLLSELTGQEINEHWLIAVEKSAPYVVTCYKLTKEYLEDGKTELERLVNEYKKWNGEPLGYDKNTVFGYFDLDVPSWAIK